MKALTFKFEVECRGGICYYRKEYYRICDVLRALQMIDFYAIFGDCLVTVAVFNEDRLVSRSEPLSFPEDINYREQNRVA